MTSYQIITEDATKSYDFATYEQAVSFACKNKKLHGAIYEVAKYCVARIKSF